MKNSSEHKTHQQIVNVMRILQGKDGVLQSVGTVRNYEAALKKVTVFANEHCGVSLRNISIEQAKAYLAERAQVVGQKSLDMERQAIQCMLRNVSKKLGQFETLKCPPSSRPQQLVHRAYTQAQINKITQAQSPKNALSTQIAYTAGLRAHELLTLRPTNEQKPDVRETKAVEKFQGLEKAVSFTVVGKGGLIREVRLPLGLANALEKQRLTHPVAIKDRNVNYLKHYDIAGGKSWSSNFSKTSKNTLGWSNGGHGCRHAYAQNRMTQLTQQHNKTFCQALTIVSQELGHFRPEITMTYLR